MLQKRRWARTARQHAQHAVQAEQRLVVTGEGVVGADEVRWRLLLHHGERVHQHGRRV